MELRRVHLNGLRADDLDDGKHFSDRPKSGRQSEAATYTSRAGTPLEIVSKVILLSSSMPIPNTSEAFLFQWIYLSCASLSTTPTSIDWP